MLLLCYGVQSQRIGRNALLELENILVVLTFNRCKPRTYCPAIPSSLPFPPRFRLLPVLGPLALRLLVYPRPLSLARGSTRSASATGMEPSGRTRSVLMHTMVNFPSASLTSIMASLVLFGHSTPLMYKTFCPGANSLPAKAPSSLILEMRIPSHVVKSSEKESTCVPYVITCT